MMSRNLGETTCDRCHLPLVKLTGPTYCGEGTYREGKTLADAECEFCGALYTAWLDDHYTGCVAGICENPELKDERGWCHCEGCSNSFYDLSYRSNFNDEPGESDLPPYMTPLEMKAELKRLKVR